MSNRQWHEDQSSGERAQARWADERRANSLREAIAYKRAELAELEAQLADAESRSQLGAPKS